MFLEVAAELASRGKGDDDDDNGDKRLLKNTRRRRRVFVVAHSGWIEQLLVGVGRRGFVPDNAELVPLLVQRKEGAECSSGSGDSGVVVVVGGGSAVGSGSGGFLEEE